MHKIEYLMESEDEILRLERKTDPKIVEKQAIWAGIESGMRVADIGCGSGKTTDVLYKLSQPAGMAVGIDGSEKRIEYARENYTAMGLEFKCKNITEPLKEIGEFDFVWVRFLLEYYRSNSYDIVKNISDIVKPGGILCLIDLDHNCLSHYGLATKLEKTIAGTMKFLEENANFDPYAGRKLYSYLYDLGYEDIKADVAAHHLIYGQLKSVDAFNWLKKIEVTSKKTNCQFEEYKGGYEEFMEEFKKFFTDPRRFTYTPLISCRGRKPKN